MGVIRRNDSGQATVELAVLLPIAIVIALVSCNAMAYLSECARFDRLARNAVRICATSPAFGDDVGVCASAAEDLLTAQMDSPQVTCSVTASRESGHVRYVMAMDYRPSLLGASMRTEVFGVSITPLHHEISLVVNPFDPGVIL